MSYIEEETIVTPWVGPTSCKNTLTVVVVSSNAEIIDKIANSLIEVHDKSDHRWKLIVLRSFHLDEIVKQADITGKIGIDFVVIGIDTSRIFCLEWTKQVLGQVHPELRCRRVILVNTSGLPTNAMAVSASEFIAFNSELNLDMMSANIYRLKSASKLSQRLLKFMETIIGVHTGILNLNI